MLWITLLVVSIFSSWLRTQYVTHIKVVHKFYITAGGLMLTFGAARIILILAGYMQFNPPILK